MTNLNEKERWESPWLENEKGWLVQGRLPNHAGKVLGVDPGVNFGITILDKDRVLVFNGKLKKQETNKIEYAQLARLVVGALIEDFDMAECPMVIEGAAFNKRFGQVNLGEVRAGYYLGMRDYTNHVDVVAPMTVRKAVFGDGRIQPGDIWPTINHNGADSLAIALYGV